jgi:hypothetical protein
LASSPAFRAFAWLRKTVRSKKHNVRPEVIKKKEFHSEGTKSVP